MKNISLQNLFRRTRAFTLVEILVSLAVLTILLLINAQVIGQVQATWSASNARVSQFREARTAFDIITRNLSQATLNTYLDYENNYLLTAGPTSGGVATAATNPGSYRRKSDLQFRCGDASDLVPAGGGAPYLPGHAVFFQAPLGVTENPLYVGLDKLLCARGYFVQFSSDEAFRPSILPQGDFRYRYRLMEYSPPAEKNQIFSLPAPTDGTVPDGWHVDAGGAINADSEDAEDIGTTRPIADNIIALIISPRREFRATAANGLSQDSDDDDTVDIAPQYAYNSNSTVGSSALLPQGNQFLLPPLVRVVLVAIDEKSAERISLEQGGDSTPPFGASLHSPFDSSSATDLDTSISQLVEILNTRRINYRVFSATVQLRGAKWSI